MNCWIFQSLPERFDLRNIISPGKEDTWEANQHRTDMAPDDFAYFWLAGSSDIRGIYGWGKLTSTFYLKSEWGKHAVNVLYRKRVDPPLLIDQIKAVPDLHNLSIIRMASGTNFQISVQEAEAIARLIPNEQRPIINLPLSRTVKRAAESFPPDNPVSAAALTEAILSLFEHRTEYAGGKLADRQLDETSRQLTTQMWLQELQILFDANNISSSSGLDETLYLDGQLALVGLGLLDEELFQQLKPYGAFRDLINQLEPSLDDLLTVRGKTLFEERNEPEPIDTVSAWSDDPLKEPIADQLGREAFARFLTRRIIAISPESGAYAIHLYGPWGAGKTTLLNFLKTKLGAEQLHLFDIESRFENDLNTGKVSEEIRQLFGQHNERLSKNDNRFSIDAEETWKVVSVSESYLLRKKPQNQGGIIEVCTDQQVRLFNIESRYEEELKPGPLTDNLRQQFERHKKLFRQDDNPRLIKDAEETWKFNSSPESYLLRKKPQNQGGKIEVCTGQQRWLIVDFNAWRNQHINPPWWSLLDTIFRSTKSELSWPNLIQEYWWRLNSGRVTQIIMLVVLFWMVYWGFLWLFQNIDTVNRDSVDIIGEVAEIVKDFGAILGLIGTIWGGIVAVNRSFLLGSARAAQTYKDRTHDPMNEIRRRFETLIKRLEPRRVAVIIDDLDRCQSKYVVELLEGIQTLFREAPIVCLVAADRRWLNACYTQEYEKLRPQIDEPGKSLGMLFLEKAFRFSTPMPGISDELRQRYWHYLLDLSSEEIEIDKEIAEQKAQERVSSAESEEDLDHEVAISKNLSFVEQQVMREESAVQQATPRIVRRLEHTLKPYVGLLDPNPRSLKRLVNAYSANRVLSRLSWTDIERHQLVLWTIIQNRWPQLAGVLEGDPCKVEKIGQENPPSDVSEKLKALFDHDEVVAIVNGGSLGKGLQAETIEMFARMHA